MPNVDRDFLRRVDKIYPNKKSFLETLKKKKIKIYHGIDPTGPNLHLGHSVPLLFLKNLQEMGHKVVILIGDFTAMIGDPSERSVERKHLDRATVRKNAATYKDQIGKILKFSGSNAAKIVYNSEWWDNLLLSDFLKIGYQITVNQTIKRDMFRKRIKRGDYISITEFLYPLLQGYDSVELEVDAEVGGTDQTFNMLVGRSMLKREKGIEKFVVTTKLLINPVTGKKISKTEGHYIPLNLNANEMFREIMALPDEMVLTCFELCTKVDLAYIDRLKSDVIANPMGAKKNLAHEIVRMYHSVLEAESAKREFERVVQGGDLPTNISMIDNKTLDKINFTALDLVKASNSAASVSEARRLIEQGALWTENRKVKDLNEVFSRKQKHIFKIGNRGYFGTAAIP